MGTSHRNVIGAVIGLLIAVLSVAGCTSVANTQLPPRTVSTATVAPAPTLTPLTAQPGWTVTVHLGYVSEGVVTSGTSFTVTKRYQVDVTCLGAGTLVISVAASTTDTNIVMCTATLQTQSVTDWSIKSGQNVYVSVAAS